MDNRYSDRRVIGIVLGFIVLCVRLLMAQDDNSNSQSNFYDVNYQPPSYNLAMTLFAPPTMDYQRLATNYALDSSLGQQQVTLESMLTQLAGGSIGFQYPTPTHRPVTRHPTVTPIPTAIIVALADTAHNEDWHPLIQYFDDVAMVLVPAGCYQADAGTHCVEKAFWLDRYEITNSMYGTSGINERPLVEVSWQEAKTFCESRGARLPTAIEWQYAASGPDSWDYPWGKKFESTYANSCDARCALATNDPSYNDGYEYIASTVRFEQGVSWVGAYNMSGNVAEWATIGDDSSLQSVHGGSWADSASHLLTTRHELKPATYKDDRIGFRCVRDY